MVFSRLILGFIISKKGKLPYPKNSIDFEYANSNNFGTNISV
jgi:hypothetical protein